MIITDEVAQLPVGPDKIPLIQNLGPATVFVARSDSDVVDTGIRLEAGESFETAEAVRSGGSSLYAVTESGTADVRIITSG
jgi:hypothetical protein